MATARRPGHANQRLVAPTGERYVRTGNGNGTVTETNPHVPGGLEVLSPPSSGSTGGSQFGPNRPLTRQTIGRKSPVAAPKPTVRPKVNKGSPAPKPQGLRSKPAAQLRSEIKQDKATAAKPAPAKSSAAKAATAKWATTRPTKPVNPRGAMTSISRPGVVQSAAAAASRSSASATPKPSSGKSWLDSTLDQVSGRQPSTISGAMKNPTPVIPYTQQNISKIRGGK